ncbi:MAG: DUF167 domain-containing protein [Dehalococcoidia bacterium]
MSQCSITIHMEPNAKRNEVLGVAGGYLRLKIAVQADDERNDYGNKEIIAFLSEILGISNERISILQGENHRIKLLGIDGLEMKQVMDKLKPHMKS